MPLSTLDRLFWALGLTGHLILLFVLIFKGRVRTFPWFTALIAGELIRTLTLLIASRASQYAYFNTYWLLAIADVLLQLVVTYELAGHVFRPLGRWAPDARRGMTVLVIASLLVAAGLTWLATPVASDWQETAAIRGSFFSSALLGELFVGMVALSVTVGLPWKTHVARIAAAFGLYSLLEVLIEAAHSLYGTAYRAHVDSLLSAVRMVIYLACLLWWIVMLWRRAPAPRALPEDARKHLRSLQAGLAYDLHTFRKWRR